MSMNRIKQDARGRRFAMTPFVAPSAKAEALVAYIVVQMPMPANVPDGWTVRLIDRPTQETDDAS